MGVTMTDGPHYYNGAKFTVRMDVGYEVCCSEGNFKDATINAKIEYSKTAEELKALADQGDMSWCPVEGAKSWEDCQVTLVKMVQENLVNFYNEADGLRAEDARTFVSTVTEEYSDESTIFYHASYDRETEVIDIFAGGDEITADLFDEDMVDDHIIITKESFKKER